jgi:hypothetical protein
MKNIVKLSLVFKTLALILLGIVYWALVYWAFPGMDWRHILLLVASGLIIATIWFDE